MGGGGLCVLTHLEINARRAPFSWPNLGELSRRGLGGGCSVPNVVARFFVCVCVFFVLFFFIHKVLSKTD